MIDSKLGIHICNWSYEAEKHAECQPAVLKSIEHNAEKLAKFKAISPGTLTVGRVVLDGFDQRGYFNFPYDAAKKVRDLILSGIKGCRYDVLEGINEPDIGEDPEKAKSIAQFNFHLGWLLKKDGFQYAAYSFAATRPHLELWPYLEEGLDYADYLAMHAYGPGPLFHESYWYLFNYRLSWEALSDDIKARLKGLLLTEYGIAKGLLHTQKDVGWLADVGPRIEPRHYGGDLLISDGQLDPYVKGAMIFQTGDLYGKWRTFEIKQLLPGLESHIRNFSRTAKIPNSPKEEEPKMDVWGNVEKYRPDVAKFKKQVGDATRDYPVPIPDYKGIAVSPAKTMAVIIAHEGNPANPNQVVEFDEKKDGKPTGRKLHAVGLCGIVAEHTGKTVEQLKDPYTNIIEGLKILQSKLKAANGVLRGAYYYYTGGSYWPSMEDWVNKIWFGKFVPTYKQFWGVNLEPAALPEIDHIGEAEKEVDAAKSLLKAADQRLDKARERLALLKKTPQK